MFCNCTKLSFIDIPASVASIGTNAFYSCNSLQTLILRSDEVVSIPTVTVFGNSPFYGSNNLIGGTVYVPQALVEEYKTATNWSVLFESGRCNFVAIEGSEYEYRA